jgi:hypothetical protein
VSISANTTGISVYILGIEDKKYLTETYGGKLGKASVTEYCIKFKTLKDVNIDILQAAIRHGIEQTSIEQPTEPDSGHTVLLSRALSSLVPPSMPVTVV